MRRKLRVLEVVTCHLHSHRPEVLALPAAVLREDTALAAAVRRSWLWAYPLGFPAPLRASRPTTPPVSVVVAAVASSRDDVALVGCKSGVSYSHSGVACVVLGALVR